MKLGEMTTLLIEAVCDKRRECLQANKMDPKIELWVSFEFLQHLRAQPDLYLICGYDPVTLEPKYTFAGYPVVPVKMHTDYLIKVL